MCLDHRKTDEQKNEWLKTRPHKITAYKVVYKKGKHYEAIWNREIFYPKRTNVIDGYRKQIFCSDDENLDAYKPYFHLYTNKRWAMYVGANRNFSVVKCDVLRKDVTAVGQQSEGIVIVAKAFRIKEEIK